jgi:uncharacterized protein (TIGR00288 family)
MNGAIKVMLLIDADNVSADVMEQAVQKVLTEHGQLHVRRAYCTAEVALRHQALFKRLSVRPMVNLSAGKNSTDIALAVDAMDLAVAERPDIVYLVSSDSDFAPLVIRLREKGCRVCGIGQKGKTGDETMGVYDAFTDLAHQGARQINEPAAAPVTPRAPGKTPTRSARTRAVPAPPVVPEAPAKSIAPIAKAPVKTAAKTAARKSATATAPTATRAKSRVKAPSEAAEFILQAVPALRSGNDVALNDVAQALRLAGLLGKHGSSLKLFDKLTAEFAVLQHPDRIRWTGAPTS